MRDRLPTLDPGERTNGLTRHDFEKIFLSQRAMSDRQQLATQLAPQFTAPRSSCH